MIKLSLLFILTVLLNCNPNIKRSILPLLGLISQSVTTPVTVTETTTTTQFVSTDFLSKDSISPVLISTDREFKLEFSAEMSESCEIILDGLTLTTTKTLSTDKKTIKLKPTSNLALDLVTSKSIQVTNCKDSNSNSVEVGQFTSGIYVAEKVIYVDSISGNDSNAGSFELPKKTIQSGITTASSGCTDRCAVAIKGATYDISASISMPLNISLFGGFDPSTWTKRRADKTSLSPYDTIINDGSTSVTGANTNPYGSIKFSSYTGIKEKTVIDGITVNGAVTSVSANHLAAITLVSLQAGAGVLIRNSILNDRCTTNNVISSGLRSYNNFGSIDLKNNSFSGSTVIATTAQRSGVYYNVADTTASILVEENTITGGVTRADSSGFEMVGVTNFGSVTLTKNEIISPEGDLSLQVNAVAARFSGNMTIQENTLEIKLGNISTGIFHSNGSGLIISKNTITNSTNTGTSNSTRGIRFNGTGLTSSITENIINLSVLSANSYGIYYDTNSNSTIQNNIINTGNANSDSMGIEEGNFSSTSPISNNTISTGTCTTAACKTIGIRNNSSKTISNNTITAGSCMGSGACRSYGIQIVDGINSVTNNNINVPTCNNTGACEMSTIYINLGTNTITGNILTTGTCSSNGCANRILEAGGGTTNTITNNTLTGVQGSTGVGMRLRGGSSTHNVSGNTINAPSSFFSGSNSVGILIDDSNYSITDNIITAGSCLAGACIQSGIKTEASTASSLTITGNSLNSGVGTYTGANRIAMDLTTWPANSSIKRNTFQNQVGLGIPKGIRLGGSVNLLRLCSNVIITGGRTETGDVTGIEVGVATNVNIVGNTILGGSLIPGNTSSLILFPSTGARTNTKIDQNIFYGHPSNVPETTCIREGAVSITNQTLVLNNFTNCANIHNRNGTVRNTICTTATIGNLATAATCTSPLTSPNGASNTADTPVFADYNGFNFHLDPSTPASILSSLGDYGGMNNHLTAFNNSCGDFLDRNGTTRVNNTAIGAYK
ncbi:MAG: hypothetical protein SFU98_12430 [Leptospiraceae bacterium]|nr:hypothetical protein [Leptospiraceae bacterium]